MASELGNPVIQFEILAAALGHYGEPSARSECGQADARPNEQLPVSKEELS
jgi:hypothetical protein